VPRPPRRLSAVLLLLALALAGTPYSVDGHASARVDSREVKAAFGEEV